MHLSRSSSNVPRLRSFLEMPQNPHGLITFGKVQNPLRLQRKTTSERRKVVRDRQFFTLFASTCASRHNGVRTACTFSTCQLPKVLRELVCLVHFDFEMCFFTHNGARFFDISTSKSGPRMRCFVQFDLEISFAPQRHAVFHLSSPQMALPL